MNLLRRLLPGIALIVGTFLLSIGLQALAAWTGPTATAPGADAYAPLNTGSTAQTKSGNLNANNFCIPSSGKCLSAAGTVTSVATNNGLTGGTITTSGTIGLDTLGGLTTCTNSTTNKLYWDSTNNRLVCGTDQTGGLSGGTANYVPKWTSATALSGSSSIYDNGNVGIGTASPSEKLHVNGNLYVGNNWYKAGNITSVNNAIGVWGAEGGVISGFNSGRAVGMGQTTSGFAGFGISSGASSLGSFYYDNFGNNVVVQSYGSGRNLVLTTDVGTSNILFNTGGGTNRMTITSGGNVGVGTTGPGEKLEVTGDIKLGRMLVTDTQYGYRSGPGIGTDGSGVGVQANYFNVGSMNGTAYSPVYASDYWINNAGRWAGSFSDVRLKKNILPLTNVLDKLLNVRGVSFNWNNAYAALGHPNDKRQIGVIAQELETRFPELVTSSSTNGYKTVNYEGLTAVLVEAVKEQQKEIDSLKARIDALEKK